MKALNLHAVGDLRFEEVTLPHRNKEEVTLRIKASGICGSDIPRIFSKGTYHFPTIPGHEFAGIVVDADESELLGRRVAVFPLMPCGHCASCQVGEYELCNQYDYYGSRRNGAFAEFLNVKKENLVIIPDTVPFELAALCEPASVALHALRRGNVKAMETVAIYGVGPIGLILANWAVLMGVSNIVMIARDNEKIMMAKKLGYAHAINCREINPVEYIQELTNGIGADVCIEGTGNSEPLNNCLMSCRKLGTVVCMGNPTGDIHLSQDAYWMILRKQLTLTGTWNSSFNELYNDWKDTIKAIDSEKLNLFPLITHRFVLADYKKAFKIIKDRTEYFCKIMFIDS
ncbi:MAG: galactitol-1-phosphate 5-dehydrogenase [Acidaminococcaceae bacterium]|nr:galactitol-1-phosphate 5-dehydrogenase [Acidaminococcaceae bacterium]